MSGAVIVGASHAGLQLAASLRQFGYDAPVTLVGDEPGLPYQRPPLSKAYLSGAADEDALALRPESFFRDRQVTLRAGARAVAIDRSRRTVSLFSGRTIAYDHLVLATGARNRRLPVPGTDLPGVFQLRTMADADALKVALASARSVAIVGAGFIGLEFAAVCEAKGVPVTVLDGADRIMARSVSPEMARAVQDAHERAGIRFLLGAAATAILGETRAEGVAAADGRTVPADLVLVGIGVVPNVELASAAGLATPDGIQVDDAFATADPAVSAIGDCANFPSPFMEGGRVRIESVQNAADGARVVAARIAGAPVPPPSPPSFWSDQGPLRLQMAGLAAPHDRTEIRGDPASGSFSVFCWRGQSLCGVESLNQPADHMIARRLLQAGASPSPAQVRDAAFDLKAFALSAGR